MSEYVSIRKGSGAVPFGYEVDEENRNMLKPIPQQLEELHKIEDSVVAGLISLREGADWLTYKTGRSISFKGLQKKIIRKYGTANSEERLGHKSRILSAGR